MLLGQTGFTLTAAAIGLAASAVLAAGIAVAFSMSRNLAQASLPVVIAFRSAPVAAIAPIIMLFLGRGINTSTVVVTIVAFFPLLVNLMRGLASADRNAAELLHVYGASRWQLLRSFAFLLRCRSCSPACALPARTPSSAPCCRNGSPAPRGSAISSLNSGEMRETELLWAAVLTSVTIALGVFWITSAGEQKVVHWRQ